MPKAKAAAQKALELDPALAEAHIALGIVSGWYDYDWAQAEREFRQTIKLNPNDAGAHLWYGQLLGVTSRFETAIAETRISQQLDPLSSFAAVAVAQQFHKSRAYDTVITQLRRVVDLDQNFWAGHINLGLAYLAKHMVAEAVSEFETANRIDNQQYQALAYLGSAYAESGRRNEAVAIVEQLKTLRDKQYVSGYYPALVYAALGARDEALDWLEKSVDERDDAVTAVGVDPMLDSLRSEPRFTTLLHRVGLIS